MLPPLNEEDGGGVGRSHAEKQQPPPDVLLRIEGMMW